MTSRRDYGWHWLLIPAAIFAALMMVGFLAWRSYTNTITAKQLCKVLSQLVHESDQNLDNIDYYKAHPDELAEAHAQSKSVLDRLNCSEYPPVKDAP